MKSYHIDWIEDQLPSEQELACYDTLEEDPRWWSYDWDHLLHDRSCYELVRDRLSPAQQADLDAIDAWWRAHPDAFNAAFAVLHHQADRRTELRGHGVTDAAGVVPEIPQSHWWWWPLGREVRDG